MTYCCSCPCPATSGNVCDSCGSMLPANNMHMHCKAVPQVAIEDFIPDVALMVPDAPQEVVGYAAREAAIRFAREAGVLRRTAWLNANPNVFSYDLTFGDCYVIGRITYVQAGDTCLKALSDVPCGDRCTAEGDWFFFDQPSTLHIGRLPGTGDDGKDWIEVNASVIPSERSCFADRILMDRYKAAIVHAAAAQLFVIPNEPWTQPNLSLYHERRYLALVQEARRDRMRGYSEQQVRRRSMATPFQGFMP